MRELTVDTVAAGGDGVGRSEEGLVVFVPRTAPGDVVRARWSPGGRFARGDLVEVVRPAASRVTPPCPHYVRDRCGGCQLQHLTIEAQREAKRRIVGDALARLGGVDAPVEPVVPSPEPWRYRRKLTLALRRRGGRWIAGLHPYDAPGAVFALEDCPITDPTVVHVWRRVLDAGALLPRDVAELRGAVRLVAEADRGVPYAAFTLEGGAEWSAAADFFAAVPELAGLWWQPAGRRRELLFARGDATGGASFAQVNSGVAELLRRDVVAAIGAAAPETVVDAYAGSGDVAAALADAGVRVTAIELDRDAAARAAQRLGLTEGFASVPGGDAANPSPARHRVFAATVESALPAALPADVVLVNPPRTGLDAAVPAALERAAAGAYGPPPRALVYVSCNPATLARDLARLPSYRVRRVTPYDMFPQTAHVETIVVLDREPAAP